MHPLISGLLSPWEFRPEVLFPVVLMGTLYVVGWLRIRRRLQAKGRSHKLASGWRLAAYLSGLGFLLLALLSPIDVLGNQLLIMHMIQHKILVMAAAPLLWLGDPFPIMLWALPARLRHAVGGLFERDTWFRRGLTAITHPAICWLVFVFTYIGWHDPSLYDLALRVPWVHNLEHITFFLTAMLFWYPVVNSAPHLHKALPYWVRIVYLIAFVPPNAITGGAIAMATDIIYPHYATVPHIWGFTALEDQAWGGAIMWIWSSEMMIQAAVIMLGVSFYQEKKRKLARERHQQAQQQGRQGQPPAQHAASPV
jgi:cytochrome c oxidase assembly factor CtaG